MPSAGNNVTYRLPFPIHSATKWCWVCRAGSDLPFSSFPATIQVLVCSRPNCEQMLRSTGPVDHEAGPPTVGKVVKAKWFTYVYLISLDVTRATEQKQADSTYLFNPKTAFTSTFTHRSYEIHFLQSRTCTHQRDR